MNAKSRTARQIIKARRIEAADARRAHTLTSHALRAGVVAEDAAGVAGALRAKGKKCGVTGKAARMFRRNAAGQKLWREPVRGARRYTTSDIATLSEAYRPRVAKFVAARELLLAYSA